MEQNILLSTVIPLILSTAPVQAQQISGTPGSPTATTTIDGRQLPSPPQPFGGVIPTPALDHVAQMGLRYT